MAKNKSPIEKIKASGLQEVWSCTHADGLHDQGLYGDKMLQFESAIHRGVLNTLHDYFLRRYPTPEEQKLERDESCVIDCGDFEITILRAGEISGFNGELHRVIILERETGFFIELTGEIFKDNFRRGITSFALSQNTAEEFDRFVDALSERFSEEGKGAFYQEWEEATFHKRVKKIDPQSSPFYERPDHINGEALYYGFER